MKLSDNAGTIVSDDSQKEDRGDSRVLIAAVYFPVYAYDALKRHLNQQMGIHAEIKSFKRELEALGWRR